MSPSGLNQIAACSPASTPARMPRAKPTATRCQSGRVNHDFNMLIALYSRILCANKTPGAKAQLRRAQGRVRSAAWVGGLTMACEDVAPPECPSIFGSCPTATWMSEPFMHLLSSLARPRAGLALLLALTLASGASAQPAAPPLTPDRTLIEETVERAEALPNLRSLIVS